MMTHTLTVKTSTNDFTLTGRPCEMSGYSFIPPLTQIPRGRKFYNNTRIIREKTESFIYDNIHHQNKELDVKAHRDDRQFSNFKGLRVKEEEVSKPVPSRTSSIYGHRMMRYGQIEPTDRTHVRMSKVNTEFFRRNGVNIKS